MVLAARARGVAVPSVGVFSFKSFINPPQLAPSRGTFRCGQVPFCGDVRARKLRKLDGGCTCRDQTSAWVLVLINISVRRCSANTSLRLALVFEKFGDRASHGSSV